MAVPEVMLGYAYLISKATNDVTLSGLAPGGVKRDYAPPDTVAPYIIVAHQAGTDLVSFGGIRGLSSMLFQAKVVGPVINTDVLARAAAELDIAITTAVQVAITGGIIKACYRSQPLAVSELVAGEQWSNIGGLYRIMASQA